ncbi:transporter substrate-binding domain-containing protein [Variovorax sp. NFACC27]|uniref:transporter substrate-binding domain-containing protein n=1 Tax=unclassified Variovorax TaxID=663243 RepID=UPI0008945CDB|nr:glutamate/aspartate transport system substrate-binding protein [Variovorax sp. NFACC28]SEG93029.1 glutamate/aspartate transport system substrate-binding protein [Variovorax sp. NFACC29]SFD68417.1 glutamate/aspartate transport system substrate-binding protein [Variovorax sp. NFACC26]SFH10956.1 glutamate/aspartate transport system substrate-binding protein [Variovorax sp. NFACC27]
MNPKSSFLTVAAACLLAATMPSFAQTGGDTLQKIKETGAITLGYRESSVPFSFLDGQQKPVGISMDLCAAIVDKVKQQLNLPKLEVKQVAVNSSNRIPLVVNGTVDVECGGTANNAARQKQVAFSVATFVSQPLWLVRVDSGVKSAADLKGKTIVVTQGSNAVGFARKFNEEQKMALMTIAAKDHGESMLTLDSNRAVAWLEDDILLAGEKANSRNPASFALVPGGFDNIYYGLMLGKDDPAFKALVDGVIGGLMKSGEFDRLYRKWFESPIPPRNVSLAFPMTEKLRERVKAPSDRID